MTRKIAVYALLVLFVFGLLVTEMAWLFGYAEGSTSDKINLILAITGIYGLGIGFFTSAPALRAIKSYAEDMTSVNIVDFVSANLTFIGFIFHFASLGLSSRSERGAPTGLRFLGGILWLLAFPLILGYAIIHLFVVLPITYLPNLLASALVTSIAYSASEIEVNVSNDGQSTGTARFKAAIKENQLAA